MIGGNGQGSAHRGASSTAPTHTAVGGAGAGGGLKCTARNDGTIKFLTGSKAATPPLTVGTSSSHNTGVRLAPLAATSTTPKHHHHLSNGISRSVIREQTLEVLQLKGGYLHPDDSLHGTSTTRTSNVDDTGESPMIPRLKGRGVSPPTALTLSTQQPQDGGVHPSILTSSSSAPRGGPSGQGHQNRTLGRNSPPPHQDDRFPLAPTPGPHGRSPQSSLPPPQELLPATRDESNSNPRGSCSLTHCPSRKWFLCRL
jgi:hypothetical protein